MGQTTVAVYRNGQLRTALKEAFPGAAIGVRNGRDGVAAINWVDGPTEAQVADVVSRVLTPDGRSPWAVEARRQVTLRMLVAAAAQAGLAGERFYEEEQPQNRWVPLEDAHGDELVDGVVPRRTCHEMGLPAGEVQPQAWQLADLALAVAGVDGAVTQEQNRRRAWVAVATLYHRWDALRAALS